MRDRKGHRRHWEKGGRLRYPGDDPGEPRKKIVRQGIQRQPNRQRIAQDLPLTERHETILRVVDIVEPIKAAEIADALGLPASGVQSTLYALQDRGLVERIPYKGWVKKAPAGAGAKPGAGSVDQEGRD
jgi:DNA-binding transcriptional ArsR family regulator